MSGKENKITQGSSLLFQWCLEQPDGEVKADELSIRADSAFDRGVRLPSGWAESCMSLPAATSSRRFTVTAAREAAAEATCKAKRNLDNACTSVLCRRSLLHSLLPTCRFALGVKRVCFTVRRTVCLVCHILSGRD